MKIVSPSAEIMQAIKNPQKHIESIARTCYKSNDLITEDSHKRFISNLVERKHWAMLEHYIFIYSVDHVFYENYNMFASMLNIPLTYMKMTNIDGRYLISFSGRTLLDLYELVNYCDSGKYHDTIEEFKEYTLKLMKQCVYDYDCKELFNQEPRHDEVIPNPLFTAITLDQLENEMTQEEFMVHGWKSVKFICDRGVSHEIVRHRDSSYAQESTRYCSYNKDKFGNEITVIKPCMFNNDSEDINEKQKYKFWEESIKHSEDAYFYLLDMGATPQEARSVLPNSLKTEIIMTARNYEWVHFFELRCDKAAHPQMREVAIPLYHQFCGESKLFNNEIKKLNILGGDSNA